MLPEVSSTRSTEVALASTPVPLSGIVTVGSPRSLLLIVSVAENGPVEGGAKTITKRALPPPGIVTGPSEVVEGRVVGSLAVIGNTASPVDSELTVSGRQGLRLLMVIRLPMK